MSLIRRFHCIIRTSCCSTGGGRGHQWSPWQHRLSKESGGVEKWRVDTLDGGVDREPGEGGREGGREVVKLGHNLISAVPT